MTAAFTPIPSGQSLLTMTAAIWDARIRRAEHLVTASPFAAEILRFYQQLATFQREFAGKIPEMWGNQPVARPGGNVRSELNLVVLLPHFSAFLDLIERAAPAPLATAARELAELGDTAWKAALADFWALGGRADAVGEPASDLASEFFPRAFLQPWAEFIAAHTQPPHLDATPRICPLCGALPLLGVLRPEGDGGKRSLVCSFCGFEWDFRRILCPACGEEEESKLPVYVAEELPHIRVEACDTCRRYLRTADLTKDGRAIPLVDDLAAIPLSLWAHEHGYARIQSNLLGT